MTEWSKLPYTVSKYSLDKDKGIYYTSKAYYDDIDYHYEVNFTKDNYCQDFQRFIAFVFNEGKKARSREIRNLFTGE